MKKLKKGLYTNGKTVVCLFELYSDGYVEYEHLFPRKKNVKQCTMQRFEKTYPVRVTATEVRKDAKKATKLKNGMYTNGRSIVTVQFVSPLSVYFNHDFPFKEGATKMPIGTFLKKYPYRLNAVELNK